jgi:hypothetical protein
MRGTFMVAEEGVEACAAAPDLKAWPAPYREGLAEGLFLDRSGYVDVSEWGARHAAAVLAAHPDPPAFLATLSNKIGSAGWAYRFMNDADARAKVVEAMRAAAASLPTGDSQVRWNGIADRLEGDAAGLS